MLDLTRYEKIFKSYDIRGVFPSSLNPEIARLIGRALPSIFGGKRVAVGRDMRLSSPRLFEALTGALVEAGASVDDLGLIPIDAMYYAVGTTPAYDGGIMITASHNPKEFNGFKMVKRVVEVVRGRDVLEFLRSHPDVPVGSKGSMASRDIFPGYIRHVVSFVDTAKLKPLKVVVDAGNGMAGKVIPLLEPYLPIKVIPLFFDLDGDFPNRPSNPLSSGAAKHVRRAILHDQADLGVMFDGDTDRLFFLDETGRFIQADVTLLLLARELLKRTPGAGIAYNVICSKAVPELITRWGGKPLRSAVGYVNVRKAMMDGGGVMGGEVSAHYSFKDNFYSDSGFIAFLLVLQLVSESGKNLSELVADLSPYCRGDEVNLKIEDARAVIAALKREYADGKQDEFDGLTVAYSDWWFNVRPSNTEPLLRVTVEAATKEAMEAKRQQLVETIQRIA